MPSNIVKNVFLITFCLLVSYLLDDEPPLLVLELPPPLKLPPLLLPPPLKLLPVL